MKKRRWICAMALLALIPTVAAFGGWNLGAKVISALSFNKNGRIEFTLFEEGSSGEEFKCSPGSAREQWFYITACSAGDTACLASVNRMASMLLAAKLSGRAVHVQRNNCEVTDVNLKP